jgi:prephenate dehydrogenase
VPAHHGRVGVLGYGRFGSALCDLLAEAAFPVAAWDPHVEVPAGRSLGGVRDVVQGARFVLLATPVEAQRSTLESIRPLLAPNQVVIDVGSVKVLPERWMAEVLGDEIPWIATHPLFGPDSLARGERPLRVVVVPSTRHPAALQAVMAFYTRLGCTVIQQEAEAHDRAMADAHALGFFIAKGLLDSGVTLGSDIVPPSAQGLTRLIHAVRVDAGHLLGTLHRENPFASQRRKDLVEALASLDQALDQESPESLPAGLQVPDLGERSPDLQAARELIDQVDRQLLGLLAQRAHLSQRAGEAKEALGASIRDPQREATMREERRGWAVEFGLDPEGADGIFSAILRASRALQVTDER